MKKKNGMIDIAAVIRIAAIKDVKTLIYAYKELTMRVPNTRLHILGGVDDEEYAAECHALVHELRLETLSFVGQVDVVKYMEQIDFRGPATVGARIVCGRTSGGDDRCRLLP